MQKPQPQHQRHLGQRRSPQLKINHRRAAPHQTAKRLEPNLIQLKLFTKHPAAGLRHHIKLQSLSNNANLIFTSVDIPLLSIQPALKACIIPALDKAVNEMMHLLLDKAVKISAEPITKKTLA